MSKRGRPANQEPATIYDYRRMKTLVDTLAVYGNDNNKLEQALVYLALAWEVEVVYWGHDRRIDLVSIINDLAKHVLEHGRAIEE